MACAAFGYIRPKMPELEHPRPAGPGRRARVLLARVDPWCALFAAGLLLFLWYGLVRLHLPNYWDEAWVYYPAVSTMATSGPGLLPADLAPELSRGHPLLFHFLGAWWMKLFGISRPAGHAFALSISAALAIATFLIGRRALGSMAGWAAATLLLANEMFIAQSTLLLPEVLLALFGLLTLAAYLERSIRWYLVFGICTVLVKESGLVVIIGVLGWTLLRLTDPSMRDRTDRRWVLVSLLPCLALAGFLTIQSKQHGWFFFPEHVGMITWHVQDIVYKLKLGYIDVFEAQGMFWTTYAFGLVAPLILFRKNWRKGLLVVVLLITAVKVLFGRWELGQEGALAVPVVIFVTLLFLVCRPFARDHGQAGELVGLCLLITVGYLLFTALNFFSDRYLVPALPLVAVAMMGLLHTALLPLWRRAFPVLAALLIIVVATRIGSDQRIGDTRLTYLDDIQVRREMVQALEQRQLQHTALTGTFMDSVYLTLPSAGYLTNEGPFTGIRTMTEGADVIKIVHDSHGAEGRTLLLHFQAGPAWIGIVAPQEEQGPE